jgi:hypothetical protein
MEYSEKGCSDKEYSEKEYSEKEYSGNEYSFHERGSIEVYCKRKSTKYLMVYS